MYQLPVFSAINPYSKLCNPLVGQIYYNQRISEGLDQRPSHCKARDRKFKHQRQTLTEAKATSFNFIEQQKTKQNKQTQSMRQCKRKFNAEQTEEIKTESVANKVSMNFLNLTCKQYYSVHEFPNVKILVLDAIRNVKQLSSNFLITNFKKSFAKLFKEELVGSLAHRFVVFVEPYLKKVAQRSEKDHQDIKQSNISDERPKFTSKQTLLYHLQDCESRLQDKAIEKIIAYYCVPSIENRTNYIKEILVQLAEQIYEKYSIRKDKPYLLLNEEGKPITDLLDLPFSTTKLLLSQADTLTANLDKYRTLLFSAQEHREPLNFIENLKQNFLQRLVGDIEQKHLRQVHTRPGNLKHVEKILERRHQRHNTWKNTFENFRVKRITRTNHNDKSNSFDKIVDQKVDSASKNKADNKMDRRVDTPVSMRSIIVQINKEFVKMRQDYELINPRFKEESQMKEIVPLKALMLSAYFSTKTEQQMCQILFAARLIQKREAPLDLSHTITLAQYTSLRLISANLCEKKELNDFLDRYFDYNEYGELHRKQLLAMLKKIVKPNGNLISAIEEIIWSQLRRSQIVASNILRRQAMHSCYDRNRVLCYLLLSLIFGCDSNSILDRAQEMLG